MASDRMVASIEALRTQNYNDELIASIRRAIEWADEEE